MFGRLYFGIGICAKYFYDSKINGFNKGEKISNVLKKISTIRSIAKSSILLSGLGYFFNCDEDETRLSFEAKNAIRPFIVAGNMQMNGNKKYIEELLDSLKRVEIYPEIEIIVAPPSLYLDFSISKTPKWISLAAQNCYKAPKGNYTGEISPAMLVDIGVRWVILGHPERRQMFCEKEDLISEKVCHSLTQGMSVIFCISETLDDRENEKTGEFIDNQMKSVCMSVMDWTKVVIAYEPEWANGEGKSITRKEVQNIHSKIREWLKTNISPAAAQLTRIIYAGPVSTENCLELAKLVDVDGFLVGYDSFEQDDFIDILYLSTSF